MGAFVVETRASPDSDGTVVHGPAWAGADWITPPRLFPTRVRWDNLPIRATIEYAAAHRYEHDH